jgi:hypothetical protein
LDFEKDKFKIDLSLIEEYLTISNIANKFLKLNSNGKVDNSLLDLSFDRRLNHGQRFR